MIHSAGLPDGALIQGRTRKSTEKVFSPKVRGTRVLDDVLKDKNSLQLVDKILEDLRRCDFEPLVVFNGGLGSVFANHSLNLSGVFNDARQKVTSLVVALKQG